MKDSLRFSVFIPVKPYVKRYLEINYGNPVNFVRDSDQHQFLIDLLHNPKKRHEKMYSNEMVKFSEEVEVKISKDDFMRYGFSISSAKSVKFNKHFETIIKNLSRDHIRLLNAFIQLKDSITKCQDLFDLTEDHWNYEAIKKDIDRNGSEAHKEFRPLLENMIAKIFLDHALKANKISKKGHEHYLERI